MFRDNVSGTIRTIDSGGCKRVIEKIKDGVAYFEKGTFNGIENDKRQADFSDCNYRIRKLTPKECFKLMGFSSEQFNKAKAVGISDSQLYKQAGNSIITNCVELIAEHLYKAIYDNTYICTDENFTQPPIQTSRS